MLTASYPKSLDSGFCPATGVGKTGKGVELTALHREEMGKFWRRTEVVSPSLLPKEPMQFLLAVTSLLGSVHPEMKA